LQSDFKLNFEKLALELIFGLKINSAFANNLKKINLSLPVNGISIFSGVSGSGKTSLLFDVIAESAKRKKAVNCKSIDGLDRFSHVVKMDQSPIGKNPLSTPLTFLNLFDRIRDLFASTELAKNKKLPKSHFSYNTKGGRCETCKGQGQIKISMDFLSDVWITFEECNVTRFKDKMLEVKWNNLSIFEILEITIKEAITFFESEEKLKHAFELLLDLGLGHLKLGQAANTLSGGEAQRIKLAKELLKQTKEQCLYLLDEPTTGLHFFDIEKLLKVLFKLRDQGHALYIVEHHPWVIQIADHLIELGPEGGEKGGYLMKN